jgi:iron complex transport system permease protein
MRGRRLFFFTALLFLAVVVLIFAMATGAVDIPFKTVLAVLLNRLFSIPAANTDPTMEVIIAQIRLPRVILGFFVGASLAVAGVAFQGLLQNPLADPYTIGVSSGAALGATASMLLLPAAGIGSFYAVPLFGFAGALIALFTVYQLGRVGGRLPVVTVLLAGVVISSFFSALISLSMIAAGEQMRNIFFWLVGGLGFKGWPYVTLISLCFSPGLALLLYKSRDLNLILLGEEEALSLGVEVERTKKIVLVAASLVTAGAVSISGMIGFVGLIVPHAVRILIGPDHRFLFPASVLGGGIFLTITDTFARSVLAPVELPVGIVTAFLGAPFFIFLLRRHREKYRF